MCVLLKNGYINLDTALLVAIKLRNMTIFWEKVPNAFLGFFWFCFYLCVVCIFCLFDCFPNVTFLTQISDKVSESTDKYFQKQKTEKNHKDAVMSIYVHRRHFLVLITLSQTLCLMLSVVLKSHKEVGLQYV